MENSKYTIEQIEIRSAMENDSNAQVTSAPATDAYDYMEDMEDEESLVPTRKRVVFSSGRNSATNWLLFGILCMLFLILVLKGE